ncbi:MAG: sigma-70 family RNA polymerase sigma factor [Tepidisphaeraceae bacterium]
MACSDSELIEEFARRKSDAAFGQIVGRYSNLVYAAARRQVGDPHLAEDVTQAAFMVLARKAASVRGENLAGWLLATTRLCALDAVKKQTRRTHYEREAAMAKSEAGQPSEIPDPQIAAWLDGAMTKLSGRACTAVALRYLQDKPVNEVAAALGMSPNAAQKILARSLVKLRKILGRRGVIVPSTAVLSAALLHESAQTAPASLVVSASSATASSVSIVKGVCQMMLWTKIKIGAAIAAAMTMLAGTGSVLLIEALAEPPAPPASVSDGAADVAPAPASVAPFASPFLELVGCRIKQSVSLKLSADPVPQANVTWVEQQYPLVQWTVDPTVAGKVNGYAISVTPTSDPAGVKTVQADKSASAEPLVEELGRAGEYDVKVSAMGADSQAVASAAVHVLVNPLPSTQIMIDDIRPDGATEFACVMQSLNLTGQAVTDDGFMNSDFVHVNKMTDDQGTHLQFTSRHQGNTYRYHYVLRKPVQVGDALLLSSSGTADSIARKLSGGVFLYAFTHIPGGSEPVRRIELYRLPAGAKLIYKSANFVSREVDGRTQIFMDVMIPPGGSNAVSFRYRLAAN